MTYHQTYDQLGSKVHPDDDVCTEPFLKTYRYINLSIFLSTRGILHLQFGFSPQTNEIIASPLDGIVGCCIPPSSLLAPPPPPPPPAALINSCIFIPGKGE